MPAFLRSLLHLSPAHALTYRARFGELFIEGQRLRAYKDGLTFAQSVPRASDRAILRAYRRERKLLNDAASYRAFIERHFILPEDAPEPTIHKSERSLEEHLASMWDVLTRGPDTQNNGTLLPLPHRYIIPGGRFREIYYWDSYFTMLGLKESGRGDLIAEMVKNFAHLIRTYGFIPNGNRSYYLTRSNPPFFPLMMPLVRDVQESPSLMLQYQSAMEAEYDFFMRGSRTLMRRKDDVASLHVVRTPQGFLNRYYGASTLPREEMLANDMDVAEVHAARAQRMYQEFHAICESGWDFSSRWLHDSTDHASSHILDLVPVDLNSLLAVNETILSETWRIRGSARKAHEYAEAAHTRSEAVRTLCYSEAEGWFMDYDAVTHRQSPHLTLAGMFPLFAGIATDAMAARMVDTLRERFLKEGGLVTSLTESGEQWDAPNGWAPLQYIAVAGLMRYGYEELAHDIRVRWIKTCRDAYGRMGVVLEKYNVVEPEKLPDDGEYTVQEGFGWTNGVLLSFLAAEGHLK